MAAQTISIFVIETANPEWQPASNDLQRVNSDISFNTVLQGDIQTLSSSIATPGTDVEGLLYVPDLAPSDPCTEISKQYIPHNATRQANLPSTDYSNLIAHAPWMSVNCTKSYLASASSDGARGFLFYLANDPNATSPPLPNDPAWGLHDGGQWKIQNKYPVYGIKTSDGNSIMQQLSYYSGNMTDAPNGHLLTEQYDARNYVRLYCDVTTVSTSTLPSLWVFLLIILGILIAILAITSLLMHIIQSRRRQQLRRLIGTGQVDLEALGIKRLKVPQEILDRLPSFVYLRSDGTINKPKTVHNQMSPVISPLGCASEQSGHSRLKIILPPARLSPQQQIYNAQSSCSICLEEFIPNETIVRELPCGHIYHPECIDIVLKEYSSLCPYCKGRVLPVGYLPTEITNAMVRRERLIRRMRERITVVSSTDEEVSEFSGRRLAVGRRMASFHRQFGVGNGSSGRRTLTTPTVNELDEPPAVSSLPESPPSSPPPPSGTPCHTRDWLRRRASALIGGDTLPDPENQERGPSSTKCEQNVAHPSM